MLYTTCVLAGALKLSEAYLSNSAPPQLREQIREKVSQFKSQQEQVSQPLSLTIALQHHMPELPAC